MTLVNCPSVTVNQSLSLSRLTFMVPSPPSNFVLYFCLCQKKDEDIDASVVWFFNLKQDPHDNFDIAPLEEF